MKRAPPIATSLTKHLVLAGLIFFGPLSAFGRNTCAHLFPVVQIQRAFSPDSHLWKKTFKLELTHNYAPYRENPDTPIRMPLVKTSLNEVEIIKLSAVDERVLKLFFDGKNVFWPQHPTNTYSKVPFYHEKPIRRHIEARKTASRSLLSFQQDAPAFTIKAGTDHPHPKDFHRAKAITKDDVDGAVLRQPFISALEKVLPKSDHLILLSEQMVLRHRQSGNGVIIRDLSRIDNENIYIPGLSLPYLSKIITETNGDFVSFIKRSYAEAVGRAKAHLLLNFGLEMETPNSQNILVEFDKKMRPTGRIVFRDLADSYQYEPWLTALGLENIRQVNIDFTYPPHKKLKPFGSNSFFLFEGAGENRLFSWWTIDKFIDAHDKAWVQEAKRLLKVGGLKNWTIRSVSDFDDYLKSSEGQQALRRYHEELGTYKTLRQINKDSLPQWDDYEQR